MTEDKSMLASRTKQVGLIIALFTSSCFGADFWVDLGNGEIINFDQVVRSDFRQDTAGTPYVRLTLAHPPGPRETRSADVVKKVRAAIQAGGSAWIRVDRGASSPPDSYIKLSMVTAIRLSCQSGGQCTATVECAFDGPAGLITDGQDVNALRTAVGSTDEWLLAEDYGSTQNSVKNYLSLRKILRASITCSSQTACSADADVGDSATRKISTPSGIQKIRDLATKLR